MSPKRRTQEAAKRKAEEAEKAAAESAARPAKKTRTQAAEEPAGPVQHPSHNKVPGTIFVFGDGSCGQLGLGEDIGEKLRPGPVNLSNGKKVLELVCGGMHTVAVDEDGEVWSWGVNDEGALGRETAGELWQKSPEATGKPGDSYVPGKVTMPEGAGRVVQLSAGDSHTAALTESGVVYAWGTFRSDSGVMGFSDTQRIQLTPVAVLDLSAGTGARKVDRVVKVASGADHIVALTERHTVYTWGSGLTGQLGRVGPRILDHGRSLEGERSALAVQLHPTEVKVMNSAGKSKVADIACGTYCTLLWSNDGKLYGWGLNNYGQLAHKSMVLWSPTLLTKFKGNPVAWASSGQHHTLVCDKEGKLWSMGRPTYGRLGRSDVDVASDEPTPEPRPVDGLEGVKVGGGCAGLAVTGTFAQGAEGLWMWGFGTNGQLAKGDDDDDEAKPCKVKQTKAWNAQQVLQLQIGGQHVAVLCAPITADEAK